MCLKIQFLQLQKVDEFFTTSFRGAIQFIKECKGLKKQFNFNHFFISSFELAKPNDDLPKERNEFLETLQVGHLKNLMKQKTSGYLLWHHFF